MTQTIIIDIGSLAQSGADKEPPVFFISDLHLDPAQSETIALCLRFFSYAQNAKALFIIGDLFEYWLGDDGADPRLQSVFDAITALTNSGTTVYLMHGNRDFLLGEQFAASVGATLMRADHVLLTAGTHRFSLMHGDTLCTDDVGYQGLRSMVRNKQWQKDFLALSIEKRIAQAQALRDKSKAAVSEKSAGIMDVNDDAVLKHFQSHASDCLIHGHTHRPYDHAASLGKSVDQHVSQHASEHTNKLVNKQESRRLVLGDWKADHAMIARFENELLTLEKFE